MKNSIIITGAAKGIGAAAARRFAVEGWNVAIIDLNYHELEALAKEIGALPIEADVRSLDQMTAAAAHARAHFGNVNAVFANAGIHRRNRLMDVDPDELNLVMQTNITGTFNTLRAAVPHIIEAGGGAVVINASDQCFIGKPGNFAYGLTKGALGQMTRTAALELAQHKVRVNAVCPGTVRTPLVESLFEKIEAAGGPSTDELWTEENALFPLGRVATPEDVANLVFFLASEQAAFCTGGLYPVDGGLTAG